MTSAPRQNQRFLIAPPYILHVQEDVDFRSHLVLTEL